MCGRLRRTLVFSTC